MKLDPRDVAWITKRLPKEVRELLKEHTCFLAGGFIRSVIAKEDVQDIDLFVPSKDVAEKLANTLNPQKNYNTKNAISISKSVYGTPIQIIHRWTFNTPLEVAPSFDFTVAKAVVWWAGNAWDSYCCDTFYQDLAAKRLVYCCPERDEDVGGSLLRVLKFYQRGYRIPLDSLAAVIARLNKGIRWVEAPEPDEPDFEAWNKKIITGLLREVDPNIEVPITSEVGDTEDETT